MDAAIRRLAWWALVLSVACLAWLMAPLTWQIWSGPQQVGPVQAQPVGVTDTRPGRVDYAQWNLFGVRQTSPEVAAVAVQSAPETRLRLELRGVVVRDDGGEGSGAIVAERGKEADYFRVGQTLPGNARLHTVYSDKILIDRNGVLETLSFDAGDGQSGVEVAAVKPKGPPATIASPEDFVAVAGERLQQDPAGALASVGLEVADSANGPAGYVFNGNNPMLSSLSLQQGDVIRSVNGHTLGNLEQDRGMLQQFYDSGMLEVEVERDGAIFTISYPLR